MYSKYSITEESILLVPQMTQQEVNIATSMVDWIGYLSVFVLLSQIFVWFSFFHCVLHCFALLPLVTDDMLPNAIMVPIGKNRWSCTNLFLVKMLQTFNSLSV